MPVRYRHIHMQFEVCPNWNLYLYRFNCIFSVAIPLRSGIIYVFWVWLSLVEYLNGVQGVGGSNPLTQTTSNDEVGFEKIKSYLVFCLRVSSLRNCG